MDQQLLDILLGFRNILAAVLILHIGVFAFMLYGFLALRQSTREIANGMRDIAAMTRDVAAMTQEVLRRVQ